MKKLFAILSLSLLAVSAQAQGKLHLYNWNNYIAAETVQRFEAACKCQLVQSYYGDNEEMLAKLAAGAKGYDLICLLYTSPSPRDQRGSRMPSSA